MASVKYWERYSETDFIRGLRREFSRGFEISGSRDDVKELLEATFSSMPSYRYPVIAAREEALLDASEYLELVKLLKEGNE